MSFVISASICVFSCHADSKGQHDYHASDMPAKDLSRNIVPIILPLAENEHPNIGCYHFNMWPDRQKKAAFDLIFIYLLSFEIYIY